MTKAFTLRYPSLNSKSQAVLNGSLFVQFFGKISNISVLSEFNRKKILVIQSLKFEHTLLA